MAPSVKHNRQTADSYIRNYAFPSNFSGATSERMAKFLHDFAEEYPGDFVNRFMLVKIGHNLQSTPREGNDKMKNCSYHVRMAGQLLQKRYQQHVVSDRLQGYRATANANDIHDTKYKQALQRQAHTTKTAMAVAATINPQNLTGSRKEDFLKTRGALKSIESQLVNLLPPPKDKS